MEKLQVSSSVEDLKFISSLTISGNPKSKRKRNLNLYKILAEDFSFKPIQIAQPEDDTTY